MLFEGFLNSSLNEDHAIVEHVYALLEDTMFEDDENLTSGEKRALTRGYELTTEPQFAAAYLRAMGMIEEDPNKFIANIINGDDDTLDIKDFAEAGGKYTADGLADAMGMASTMTFQRISNKFKNLIDGIGDTEREKIYPKILSAYEKFKKLNVHQIGEIAGDNLQQKDFSKNRDNAEAKSATSAQGRVDAKKETEEIGRSAYTLAKSLRKHFDLKKSQEQAINKIAQSKNIKGEVVKMALAKYIKDFDVKLF